MPVTEHDLCRTADEIQLYAALLLKFFNQALEGRLRELDERLSSLQYSILRMLQIETLTISVISQRTGLEASTLVRSVDALERKDLARRGSDPRDRRRNPIMITAKGMRVVSEVSAISAEDLTFQALQSIGSESAAQLRDLLRRLITEFPEGRMVAEMMSAQVERP